MKQFLIALPFVLTGCAELAMQSEPVEDAPPEVTGPLDAPPPPSSARSVEEFDTTTEAQRIAAVQPTSGGRLLGSTVASLGDATQPGFWMSTPLVDAVREGRVVYPETGKSVEVELRPASSGSSRVSLAALRLLEAPLTGLPVLEVYAN